MNNNQIVLKFGGTSVATAENIKRIAKILSKYDNHRIFVVVSALSTVTNLLQLAGNKAVGGVLTFPEELEAIEKLHFEIIEELIPDHSRDSVVSYVNNLLQEAYNVCESVSVLREFTHKSRARLLSMGERLSSFLISEALNHLGVENYYLDSSKVLVTNIHWEGIVNNKLSAERLCNEMKNIDKQVVLMPGFIASTHKGDISAIGRGGSDLTASLVANYIEANRLEIWTDISGVYTASPKLVSSAYPLKELSYEEAIELSYFGAKVIYSPSIQPVFEKKIPILVKNTFEPDCPGTIISEKTNKDIIVKGFSAIDSVSLITVSGAEMVGVHDIISRTFNALASISANVLFTTQSSSEHDVNIGLSTEKAILAVEKLNEVFELEIERKTMNPIAIESSMGIVAIVGEGMRQSKGMAGKAFKLLGDNGVNIRAIAQGNSERNITIVVAEKDLKKAINVLHDGFLLSKYKKIHLFNVGVGSVGSELLNQISNQHHYLKENYGIDLRLAGLAGSQKMIFDPKGIDWKNWRQLYENQCEAMTPENFVANVKALNLRNSIFIDNTASEQVVGMYKDMLDESLSIICSNKIMATQPQEEWDDFKKYLKRKKVRFLNETNVAAGLPVLKTIKDMVMSGDKILKIQAVLSGSLNFIFNTISKDISFSQAIKMARENKLTEPNPAIDISGLDVRRKVLILARYAGYSLNLEDVVSVPIVPHDVFEAKTPDQFIEQIKKYDADIEKQRLQAEQQNKKLRFFAEFDHGKSSVGLQAVGAGHPAFYLDGKDNIVLIYSNRYHEQPLVVKGAGAGDEVTASGVFADIIRLCNEAFSE